MDIRNVQKTGEMFYLYLPTRWCKKFNINGKSKVGVQINKDSSLAIYPHASSKVPTKLSIKTSVHDVETLQKLIVASYISPADSFKITLDKELDVTTILNQKNLVSLELVEIDGKHIRCESSLTISDPAQLLLTMIRKVRNLLLVMQKEAPKELIERYEGEIDRSKLLIEKSVISSFVDPKESKNETVELHFISLISKGLEGLVDHVIALKTPSKSFLVQIAGILRMLQDMLTDGAKKLNSHNAMQLVQKVGRMQGIKVKDVKTYDKRRAVRALNSIGEVVVDWAVCREVK